MPTLDGGNAGHRGEHPAQGDGESGGGGDSGRESRGGNDTEGGRNAEEPFEIPNFFKKPIN
jgi:hypothetical protein